MEIASRQVGLLACPSYGDAELAERLDRLCDGLGLVVSRGSRVLLKPNLVSSRGNRQLACSQPEFVAAVARWFVARGARVAVGDSPAFGSAKGVMAACGIADALRGLPVELVNFDDPQPVRLASGLSVGVARQALECDLLVNLPRVKAHDQLYLTMAVKNYFGAVVGFRKAWLHARHGDIDNRFESLLVDLLAVLPTGISLVDGVVAMQRSGPMTGESFALGVLAAGANPVAVDTALMAVLGLPAVASPLWRECARRGLAGCRLDELAFPLARPEEVSKPGFAPPGRLAPVSFHPWRLFTGAMKRVAARWGGG
ncbi:MAG: DUF362 domain-containing protein [Thermodesulfobacteriota bacterium]